MTLGAPQKIHCLKPNSEPLVKRARSVHYQHRVNFSPDERRTRNVAIQISERRGDVSDIVNNRSFAVRFLRAASLLSSSSPEINEIGDCHDTHNATRSSCERGES